MTKTDEEYQKCWEQLMNKYMPINMQDKTQERTDELEEGLATQPEKSEENDINFLRTLSTVLKKFYSLPFSARRLQEIANRLEQLDANPLAPSYVTMAVPYAVADPIQAAVYDASQQAILFSVGDGDPKPRSSISHVDMPSGPCIPPPNLTVCATYQDSDSNVKALAEASVCPQGCHLKDGPCRRDFCWCTCSKCKADCGEK